MLKVWQVGVNDDKSDEFMTHCTKSHHDVVASSFCATLGETWNEQIIEFQEVQQSYNLFCIPLIMYC